MKSRTKSEVRWTPYGMKRLMEMQKEKERRLERQRDALLFASVNLVYSSAETRVSAWDALERTVEAVRKEMRQ